MGRFRIQLIKKGKGIGGFALDIEKKIANMYSVLHTIGDETAQHMQNTINTNSKHGTGKLGNAIKVYDVKDGVGVGNIAFLKQNAPYWYVLNYGRTISGGKWIPPANRGHFEGGSNASPIENGGNEKWVHTGNRADFMLRPKRYTPISYIEQVKAWLGSNFRSRINSLTKK